MAKLTIAGAQACPGLRTVLSLCLALAVQGASAQPAPLPSFDASLTPEEACAALAGTHIDASEIGLPTTGASIREAQWQTADAEGNTNGEFCQLRGAIHPVDYTAPDINFQVNLPSDWNGKSLQFGGGGLNGTLITGLGRYVKQPDDETTPLARGYVTLGSDSGHQSGGGFDGRFYLNREALENFGGQQIKKTHDVALRLIEARYGRAPDFNYFLGGSQGGHEAFDAVQRFPEDYDGVVAGYPAHNVLMLHLSALNFARALQASRGAAWLNPAEAQFLREQVYARCDALDGAEDGIISNVKACVAATATFKELSEENPLRCENGRDSGDSCLSDPQLDALNVIDTPYILGFRIFRDDEDSAVFPRWTPFEGSTFTDGGLTILGAEGPHEALQVSPALATNGLAIAQDPSMDVLRDFDPLNHAGRITELSAVLSANSVNLDRFRDRGGKLIFFHGTVDDFITPYSSVQYYDRLVSNYGGEAGIEDFVRFYMIPGMGHVTGVFNARLASLDALEAWVERGEAPGELLASDANAQTAGRTRPVCRWPQWPRYNGSGDLNQAASFRCSDPE